MKPYTSGKCHPIALLLVAILLIPSLPGCQNSLLEQTPLPAPTSQPEPTPPPEPTDTLVLYYAPFLSYVFEDALALYREKFPDVQVDVRIFGDTNDQGTWLAGHEEYNQILRNELIVGEGPDLVFLYHEMFPDIRDFPVTLPDLYKTMSQTNAFLNLEPFFQSDPNFNGDDYVEGVFNAGLLRGRRLFVPLFFEMPA